MSNEEHLVRKELQTPSPALRSRFAALREDAAHLEDPTMRNSLIARAMTTPSMRKPISLTTTMMITASVAAFAFLMVNFFGSSDSVRQPKPLVQSAVTTINIETLAPPKAPSKPHSQIVETQTHSGVIYQTNAASRDSDAYGPVNLTGVTPIEIPEQLLPKLGVRADTSGNIVFYNRQTFSQRVESHTLVPSIGVGIGYSISDTSGIQVMSEAPRMVTNVSGALRFLRFDVHDYSKPNVRKLFHADSLSTEHGSAEVTFGESAPMMAIRRENDHERFLRDHPSRPSLEISNGTIGVSLQDGSATATSGVNNQISITPLVKDSLGVHLLKDSSGVHSGTIKQIPIAQGVAATSTHANSTTYHIARRAGNSEWDSIFSSVIKDVRGSQPDVNHLIPVLVRNTKGSVLNEVIMWYDPSPELTAILPEVTQSSSVAPKNPPGALKELTISPNPAGNNATIHYTLSEERSVRFTLYTLVGERVLQITSSEHHSGGSGTVPVDLVTVRTGVYLLVAVTDKGEQLTQRLVVEK